VAEVIAISGGSGLVGGQLVAQLSEAGAALRLLSRNPRRIAAAPGVSAIAWDGLHPPIEALAGCSAVVHLAGEPLFGRLPSRARLARIRSSRVDSTRALVQRLGELPSAERPRALLCASAVGYYGDGGERELSEDAPPGAGFCAELCVDWEACAARAEALGLRVVRLRFGVVLARRGGALARMLPLFRAGLGGRLGSGRQFFPWIHLEDAAALLQHALRDETLHGPLNAVAPETIRNADWTRALAKTLRRPAPLPVPSFALRAALGPLAAELLENRRVSAARASQHGFSWRHPTTASALQAELGG